MSGAFARVSRKSDWGYWDQLDGETLRTGETIEVLWPDGSTSRHRCQIDRRSYHGTDTGSPIEIPDETAYVKIEVRGGAVALVPLRQELGVRRDRGI